MDRRNFFKLVGTASGGVAAGACGHQANEIIPLRVAIHALQVERGVLVVREFDRLLDGGGRKRNGGGRQRKTPPAQQQADERKTSLMPSHCSILARVAAGPRNAQRPETPSGLIDHHIRLAAAASGGALRLPRGARRPLRGIMEL